MKPLNGLSGVYSTTILQKVANGLFKLFIPIYIYSISNSLAVAFIYQILFRLTLVLSSIPVTNLINILGPDTIIIASNITQLGYFLLMIRAKYMPNLIYPTAILSGITTSLFWLPYHHSFSALGKKGKFPKHIATLYTFTKLASVGAPLFGGLIAGHFGYSSLFVVGATILILSSIPILMDSYNRKTEKVYTSKIFKSFNSANKKLYLAYFFDGFRISMDNNFWPILMYLLLPNLEKLGALKTISLILTLLATNILGRKLKSFKLTPLITGNVIRNSLWAMRGLNFGQVTTLITEPIYKLAGIFYKIPQKSLTYELGKNDTACFFTAREWAIGGGILLADLIALLVLFSKLPNLSISLIAIIGISLSTVFLSQYSKEKNV